MTWWFLARAAGFMALLAATLTICLGAATSGSAPATRFRHRESRLVLQLAHRSAAVATLALLALHAVLLVLDRYVAVSLPGALVPFTAGYRGVAVGLGTLAAYAFLVAAASGAARGRLAASPRAVRGWRPVHAAAYAAWPLAVGHGLLAGTDTRTWWSWSLYGASTLAVAGAVWWRLSAEERHVAAPLAARRQSGRHDSADRVLTTGSHR